MTFIIHLLQGLRCLNDEEEMLLGRFAYDNRGSRIQYFEIKVSYFVIVMSKIKNILFLSSPWLKVAI
jgi:hypothetical protein